jgi:ssDNA-binding replication factor A large subunit
MKVCELRPKKRVDDITLNVIRLVSERSSKVYGRTRLIREFRVGDGSGECDLTLIDPKEMLAPGDSVRIINGYARPCIGGISLTIGKYGSMVVGRPGGAAR